MLDNTLHQTTLQGTDIHLRHVETKDMTPHNENDTNILHEQARMSTVRSRVKKWVVIVYATHSLANRSGLPPDWLVQPFPFAAGGAIWNAA